MDRVRFGRALGVGTRAAAKAALQAADAAVSPAPPPSPRSAPPEGARAQRAGAQAGQRLGQGVAQVRATGRGVRQGGRRFGEAVWGPMVRVSGVVSLQVTGIFFSLFALTGAIEVWKHRADLHAAGAPRTHVLLALGMTVVFTWFTLSNFLRAARRDRRR